MNESEYRIEGEVHEDHWWYAGRRKLLSDSFDFLLKLDGRQFFDTVYDIGCSTVGNARCIKPKVNTLIGVEPNAGACRAIAEKYKEYQTVINSDLEHLQIDSLKKADVAIAMDVFEHLENDNEGIKIFGNLVKSGGYAIVTVPAFMSLWGFQDVVSNHYRRYTLRQLTRLLEGSGFKVLKKSYFNTFLFPIVWIWRKISKYWKPKKLESENQINTVFVNALVKILFKLEIHLIKLGLCLPFGVSAYIVAKKN